MPRNMSLTPKISRYHPAQEMDSGPGFTRFEVLVLIAVVTLLASVVLPALANNRPRSHRVICANNLRQIGVALQIWANDHNDLPPYDTRVANGGTLAHPLAPNVWFHFAWISNELASPRLVFCPSDSGRPASDFSGNPDSGYLHPNFANRATSYFISHFFTSFTGSPQIGDRNVRTDGSSGCYRFLSAPFVRTRPTRPDAGWTNGMHESAGNLLFSDGRVEQASNERFREAMDQGDDTGANGASSHLAVPR